MTTALALSFILTAAVPASAGPEPTRIVIECEDMQGVRQDRFGAGEGWQVGRWGHDLLQNMTFGGTWASRLRTAMTDAGDNAAEITTDFDVPADGTYKVWVKYECPPHFNCAFGVKIERVGAKGRPLLDKVYGLREAAKHYCFMDKPLRGDLFWNWGIDHDAAEGYEAKLAKGRYRLAISKTKNPEPRGPRSIDAILITSDLSDISSPRMPRYPLLDELRRANHVYFRFRNPKTAAGPIRVQWNHWLHRCPDFYSPFYRDLVRFYDAGGKQLVGGKNGDWPEPIAPGAASPWYDLGPTMNTESTSPFEIWAVAEGSQPAARGASAAVNLPLGVDIALGPRRGGSSSRSRPRRTNPRWPFWCSPTCTAAKASSSRGSSKTSTGKPRDNSTRSPGWVPSPGGCGCLRQPPVCIVRRPRATWPSPWSSARRSG